MDLGTFYEKHKQFYYWFLYRKLKNTGLPYHAEDIIHDAVVAIIANEKHLEIFENLTEKQAKQYFKTCLVNRLIDTIRQAKRKREQLEELERTERSELREETSACSMENAVIEKLNLESCAPGVLCLFNSKEMELIRLVFLQELPYREVARIDRVRESAIAMRVVRLRKKIWKICLKQHVFDEFVEKRIKTLPIGS